MRDLKRYLVWLLLIGAITAAVQAQTASDSGEETLFESVSDPEIDEVDEAEEDIPPVQNLTILVTEEPERVKDDKRCHTDLSGPFGRFASRNFPETYERNTNCSWFIQVQEGHRVQLTFHLFNVEHNPVCRWDSVRVLDSNGTLMNHLCGVLLQDMVLTSTGSNMTVNFTSDHAVETAGFLASWRAVPVSADETDEPTEDEQPGYLLTFPQAFPISAESSGAEVCLQMFNIEEDGEVSVNVFRGKDLLDGTAAATETFSITAGDNGIHCKAMRMPVQYEDPHAVVKVSGEFGEYKLLSYKSVNVVGSEPLLLLQTDKADYRPKQKVYARILATNYELKPSTTVTQIYEMYALNPAGDRIGQWREVQLTKGMAQVEMDLPEEPLLGVWSLRAKVNEEVPEDKEVVARFQVNENVLPKFEVEIQPPPSVIRGAKEANFTVCATYTHGSKVKGALNATFYTSFPSGSYWRAPLIRRHVTHLVEALEQGCATVTLNSTDLATLHTHSRKLYVEATVTEAVTGTKQNATYTTDAHYSMFQIVHPASATTHVVGGFPYVGDFKVQEFDGTAKPGVNLHVCARLFTSLDSLRGSLSSTYRKWHSYKEDQFLALADKIDTLLFKKVCNDYKSDANGRFSVAIPLNDVPANVTKLSILVKATDFPTNVSAQMGQPTARLDVGLTHINATNILAIHEKTTPRISCFDSTVTTYFTALEGSQVDFSYYVTSAGSILESGQETVTVGNEDLIDSYSQGAEVIALTEKDPNATAREHILSKHDIQISRPFEDDDRVANKVKVLVFIKDPDGKVLSDTREYDADVCTPQPVAKFSRAEARPGDAVSFSIDGDKEAYCGYSVVDKSVDLVANPNKVTRPRLQKLREDVAKRRLVNVNPSTAEGCTGTKYLFTAFQRLGLFVMSDQLVDLSKCQRIVDLVAKPDLVKRKPIPVTPAYTPFDPTEPEIGPIPYEDNSYGYGGTDYYYYDYANDYGPPQVAFQVAPSFALEAAPAEPQLNQFSEPSADEAESAHQLQQKRPGTTTTRRPGPAPVQRNEIQVRDYFPETWLFDLVHLDEQGHADIELKAPHTITTWVADVFCSGEESGIIVANQTSMKAIQDFFADLNMPYSVKRGEILPVNVSVFNTVARDLPMKLSVLKSADFKVGQMSQDLCLAAEDQEIKTFLIKAKTLNEVNITVEAKITDSIDVDACEAEAAEAEGFTDILKKPIFVKPEGFPVEKTQTVFQCLEEGENEAPKLEGLELPGEDDLVEGSARAWVMVSGDIMAPAIANLDKLLHVPYGCGEQNMISTAPNVYVLDYFRGVDKQDSKIESKAKKHINDGFQRQQQYRHKDGSYSVWGTRNDKGSTWLTAFVLKVFTQASNYVELPYHNLQQSLDFLVRKQRKDGCFEEHGYSYSLSGDKRTLTATVLITLIEAQNNARLRIPRDVMELAHKCVTAEVNEAAVEDVPEDLEADEEDEDEDEGVKEVEEMDLDAYAKSIITYAMSLTDSYLDKNNLTTLSTPHTRRSRRALSDDLLSELMELANTTVPGKLFWNGRHNSLSKAVETTAYAVLSLTLKERLPESLQAIKWMAGQRNSYGGFVSTQDTIVALHAIAQFSGKVSAKENDLYIDIIETQAEALTHSFRLDDSNLLLLQREKLSGVPNGLDVAVEGQGCFMVQTVLRYNVKASPNKKDFDLKATLLPGGILKLCATYTGSKKATEMVVLEFELLTGFVADKDSLEGLLNDVASDTVVKRYEYDEDKGKIALYFDEIPAQESCWEIRLERRIKMEKLRPANVIVYDYYNQEDIAETEYHALPSEE